MGGKPKTYLVDDVLNGYNDYDKLRRVYQDLRSNILAADPIQRSTEPLITLQSPNWRSGNYGWELFDFGNNTLVMMEYFGSWKGYGTESRVPPRPEEGHLHNLRITIHNSNVDLEEAIETILNGYPRESRKRESCLSATSVVLDHPT